MGSYDAVKRLQGIFQAQTANRPAPRRVTNHLEDELIYNRAAKDAAKNIAEAER
jgi:hypothetical protein